MAETVIAPPVVAGKLTGHLAVAVPPTTAFTVTPGQKRPSVPLGADALMSDDENATEPVGDVTNGPRIAWLTVAVKVTFWVAVMIGEEDATVRVVAVPPTESGRGTEGDPVPVATKLASPM